jgi:hypothetical protein
VGRLGYPRRRFHLCRDWVRSRDSRLAWSMTLRLAGVDWLVATVKLAGVEAGVGPVFPVPGRT